MSRINDMNGNQDNGDIDNRDVPQSKGSLKKVIRCLKKFFNLSNPLKIRYKKI